MPNFHRLTVPSYYGGLPSAYDYINNATSGTPSNANGVLTSGPNAGSYFIGFGDDGTSANANRPNLALAQNTDYLDNLLHQDLAITVVSATAAGGPGVTSLVLPVGTFLGVAGTTNTPTGLNPYFHITDDSNNDIIDASGNPVIVASLTLTSPDVIGVGFSQNTVTAVFSEAIPTGRNYRIYYSTRTQLATLPQDAFINIRIRSAQEVPEETEALLQALHGNGQAWDAEWTSTIWDLARSGLNERYKRATVADASIPGGWPVALGNNVAGTGGWYSRTGPGITGYSTYALTTPGYATPEGWMSGALFASIEQDSNTGLYGSLTEYSRVGGDTTGFYYLGHQRFTTNTAESPGGAVGGFAGFFHGAAVEVSGTADSNFYTWLPAGAVLTFSADNTASVGTGWFALAGTPLQTAMAMGYDLVEVDFGDGLKRQLVVTGLNSTTSAQFSNRDGSNPDATGATATVIRWVRMMAGSFENAPLARGGYVGDSGNVFHYNFIVAYPPPMSSLSGDNFTPTSDPNYSVASFFGPDESSSDAVVSWGGYDLTELTYLTNGFLYADGSADFGGNVNVDGNLVAGSLSESNILRGISTLIEGGYLQVSNGKAQATSFASPVFATAASTTATLNSNSAGAIHVTNPSGSGTYTVNVTNCTNLFQEFTVVIRQTAANYTTLNINCDNGVSVHFESGTFDSTLGGANATDVYRGTIVGTNCYMSVQRFPGV